MDKLKTTGIGGFPFILDDIRQFLGRLTSPANHGIYQALNNLLRGFGEDFIVQGVVASGSSPNIAITEGWVILAGELIKVDAQTGISTNNTFVKVTTFDSRGNKDFQNGTTNDTYEKNRALATGTGGNLAFDGVTLIELTSGADTLPDTGRVELKKKIVEIGNWNMDTTPGVSVTHGISDFAKIRSVTGIIIRDDNLFRFPLDFADGNIVHQIAIGTIDPTTISLSRLTGGQFDGPQFNDIAPTLATRGFITIEFEA